MKVLLMKSLQIFFLLVIIFISNKNTFSQINNNNNKKEEKNEKSEKKDSVIISKKLRFTAPRIGVNLVPLGIWALDNRFQQVEFSAEIPFNPRYWVAIDAGQSTVIRGDNRQTGSYMRVGAVYNLWFEDKSKHGGLFGVGIQYGKSFFSQEISQTFQNTNFPAVTLTEKYSNLTADWLELVCALEGKISKHIYFSPFVKLKFLVNVSNKTKVVDIAGFGNNNFTKLEAGYRIFWQF